MILDRIMQRLNFHVCGVALLRLFLLCSFAAMTAIEMPASVFQFSQWGKVGPASGWTFLEGDFTGNGNVSELVGYSPSNGTLWVGRNTGSGFTFSQWGVVSPASGWKFVAGNFTNSSRTDLMGYSPSNGTLWVGKSTGSSFTFSQWATVFPAAGWSFASGLFTNRGAGSAGGTDIMGYYQGDGSVWVGKNLGSSFSFSKWGAVSPAAGWTFMAGPFTRSSSVQDDIVGYFSGNGTLWVGANTGTSFAFSQWGVPSTGNWSFVPGFFAGDGNEDLMRYDPSNGTLLIERNAASLFSLDPVPWGTVSPAAGWSFVAGRFTNSGNVDIMGYYSGDGSLWVGRNTGLPPEGYAWPLSAAPGQTISFHVSGNGSNVAHFTRYTTNAAGQVVGHDVGSTTFTPAIHAIPDGCWSSGCDWPVSFNYTVPAGATSGIYAARLLSPTGAESYVPFIVNPDPAHRSNIAVIANVNTWLAYNEYGGRGKYDGGANVSFLRPMPDAAPVGERFGNHHQARAELWVLGWLEQQGIKFDVYTDIDLQNGIPLVDADGTRQYDKLILDTHPEYWTTDEYGDLSDFLDAGGSLLYLGGNGIFETGTYYPNQTGMIFSGGQENSPDRFPFEFRSPQIGLPEINLLGIAYVDSGVPSRPYEVVSASHPVFQGTGLSNGDALGTIGLNTGGINPTGYPVPLDGTAAGWEVDTTVSGPPDGVEILARGAPLSSQDTDRAEMIFWNHPGGGFVFSVGSITFGGSLAIDTNVGKVVRNVLSF